MNLVVCSKISSARMKVPRFTFSFGLERQAVFLKEAGCGTATSPRWLSLFRCRRLRLPRARRTVDEDGRDKLHANIAAGTADDDWTSAFFRDADTLDVGKLISWFAETVRRAGKMHPRSGERRRRSISSSSSMALACGHVRTRAQAWCRCRWSGCAGYRSARWSSAGWQRSTCLR